MTQIDKSLNIVQTSNPYFIRGINIRKVIHDHDYPGFKQALEESKIKKNPIINKGRWYIDGDCVDRECQIYHDHETKGFFITGHVIKKEIIKFRPDGTKNKFRIDMGGVIRGVKHPGRCIKNPIGVCIWDIIAPEYLHEVRKKFRYVLTFGLAQPVEYEIQAENPNGETVRLFEKGIFRSKGKYIESETYRIPYIERKAI